MSESADYANPCAGQILWRVGDDLKKINTVQDRFSGTVYRAYKSPRVAGGIEASTYQTTTHATSNDGNTAEMRWRIVTGIRIHHSTVRAMLRRIGEAGTLESGIWYEVHTD